MAEDFFMVQPAPSRRRAVPRYDHLARTLLKEIQRGTYPVGSNLPTEHALCGRFEVSRFTVREALRHLTTQGVIVRRQGSGSIVVSTEPARSLVQELRSVEELLQYSAETRLRVVGRADVAADTELAAVLHCDAGEPWHRIEAIRLHHDTTPVCWSEIYVRPEYAAVADVIGKRRTPVYGLLEEEFGLSATDINVEIFSGTMEARKAKILNVKSGVPSLIIVRRYKGRNGRHFEISVSEHPAGRFSFSIDLHRAPRNT
jgi:DNA-binding GntR family transcriptional regulator